MTSAYPAEPLPADGGEFRGSRSTVPDHVQAEIVTGLEQGQARAEIARRVGLSAAYVSRFAARHGYGFSDTRTEKATRARLIQLQWKRLEQGENLHLGLDQAIALAAYRMATKPDDARGISEATRAVRDLASAYRDLASIDAQALVRTAGIDVAYEFIDAQTWALEHAQPDDRGVIAIGAMINTEEEDQEPEPSDPTPGGHPPEESARGSRPSAGRVLDADHERAQAWRGLRAHLG